MPGSRSAISGAENALVRGKKAVAGGGQVGSVGGFVSAAEMLHSKLAEIEADTTMTAPEKVEHFLDAVVVAEGWYVKSGELLGSAGAAQRLAGRAQGTQQAQRPQQVTTEETHG